MFNYTTTAIVLLVRMNLLTEDAGRHLAENLQSKIHTARYNDAFAMVDEMLRDLEEKDKYVLKEPWMPYIRRMERQLDSVTKAYEARIKALESKEKVLTPKK